MNRRVLATEVPSYGSYMLQKASQSYTSVPALAELRESLEPPPPVFWTPETLSALTSGSLARH